MNIHQVSRVDLSPGAVDCIVFWTKNPGPMLSRIQELNNYNYYFQFTLTSYDKSIEPGIPGKKHIVSVFKKLSEMIGKERVVWRYDPILLTDHFSAEYHVKWFGVLAEKLSGYTEKCIISFMDLYKKAERHMKGINLLPLDSGVVEEIAYSFSVAASRYGIQVVTCSENIDLSRYNIKHGSCIDGELISKITGKRITCKKDPGQRPACGCVKSVDIGAYNTCRHGCRYCYANFSRDMVLKNIRLHDEKAPLLYGALNMNDKISERKS